MSIFLRSFPQIILLNPLNSSQFVTVFENHNCHTLYFQWQVKKFVEPRIPLIHAGYVHSYDIYGSDTNNMDIHLKFISDSLGLLLISSFFNAVYKLHPNLAIQSIHQAFYFNHHLKGLFILQALNRLSYAYFGLDYEFYRNHEEIKSRSIIEDFHSILGSILILPERTLKNEGTVWQEMSKLYLEYEFYTYVYEDIFIDYLSFVKHTTNIFQFSLSKHTILAPFFAETKAQLYHSYGEYRALRTPANNNTYLYKSFISQPQNCDYENIEIKKMGIKTSFEYKKIGLEENPYSKWEEKEEEERKRKEFRSDREKSDKLLRKIPSIKNFPSTIKNTNNINSDYLGVYVYPKELLELWIKTSEILEPYLKINPVPYNGEALFKLNYEKTQDLVILGLLEEKISNALQYLINMHILVRDRNKIEAFINQTKKGTESEIEIECKTELLKREVEASMYLCSMIRYFGELKRPKE